MELDIPEAAEKKYRFCKILLTYQALTKFKGNKQKTCDYLGIARRTLNYWISLFPELKEFRIIPNRGNEKYRRYPDK